MSGARLGIRIRRTNGAPPLVWLASAVGLVGLSSLDGLAALLATDDGVEAPGRA